MTVDATIQEVPDAPSDLEIRLFGTFDVRVRGHALPPLRYRKELWILALLALRQGRDVPRDWLAATFWPDNDESKGLFYLRKSLSNLRNALGEEAGRLQSPTPRTVRLDLSDALADVAVFDTAISRAHGEGDPAREERLAHAVGLYRGPLLQDCPDDWALTERQGREQSYLAALEQLASLALARGESAAAARWLRLALATEPFRESAACALMQTLADSGDRAALGQVYQDLRLRLRQDLNTSPAPETEALYKKLTQREAQPQTLPADVAPAAPTLRHLPVPLTDLIGRGREIGEVAGWLERRRLVTLVGAGGVGKTRLSIAAADAALPRFPDGVWFVDLSPLSGASLVPEVVAKVLGLTPVTGRSAKEGLIAALETRSLLLVLDNCEHLLDACASLAQRLLSACPGLRLLATSRQPLGVTGEQTFPVPSLALPSRREVEESSPLMRVEKNPAFLMDYAGIQLFVQRAVLVNPAFRLERRNAEAVAQICQHLDGIPLAIEMAAARVRSLSVDTINSRLDQRFRLLTGGSRAALPRQQTLRALIDWSYDLLSEDEKTVLRRLSVFAGGWTLPAAESVCAGGPIEAEDVLELLTGLVDKSLVVADTAGGNSRYRLLETIRQYAADLLRERNEDADLRQRLLDYFLVDAEEIHLKLQGPEQAVYLDRLDTELGNQRQVLKFCETADEDTVQKGLHLMHLLGYFWLIREHLNEGRQHCAAILERAETFDPTPNPNKANVWMLAGNIELCLGDSAAARRNFEKSLALRQQMGERKGLAGPLGSLGNITHRQGDYAAAQRYFEESVAICREFDLDNFEAIGLTCLSNLAADQQRFDEARARSLEALSVCRRTGNISIECFILQGLSVIALAQDDYADAVSFCEQTLAVSEKVGHTLTRASALCNLATARAHLGETAEAARVFSECLSAKSEGGDLRAVEDILESVGDFLSKQAHQKAACVLWGLAEKIREDFESLRTPRDQGSYERTVATVRQSLDSSVIDAAWAEGRAMTIADGIAYALRETEAVRAAAETH